jgi:hypothetical protein
MFSTGRIAIGRSDAGQLTGKEAPSKRRTGCRLGEMSMRKTTEVLRLKFELGLGQRQIARSCGMGLGTVNEQEEKRRRRRTIMPL